MKNHNYKNWALVFLVTYSLLISFQNCSPFRTLSSNLPSSAASLNDSEVSPAFAIDTNPESVTVPAGTTVNFQVNARGPTTLTYLWFKNGRAVLNSNSPILTLPNVTASDAGEYLVIITSGNRNLTSLPATLTLAVIPDPQPSQPAPEPSPAPSPAACVASSSTQGYLQGTLSFFENAKSLAPATNKAVECQNSTNSSITSLAGQNWPCDETAAVETAVRSCVEQVDNLMKVPTIASQPASVTLRENQTLQLSVTATGPDLRYQWYFNQTPIGGANSSIFSTTAEMGNQGSYWVTVQNNYGSATSQAVNVTVYPAIDGGTEVGSNYFSGGTNGCSYDAPSSTFVAPTSGPYVMTSLVAARGNYYFILPILELRDSSGNVLVSHHMSNEIGSSASTFYHDNVSRMDTSVQLYKGQTYTLTQYYSVRWCYNNQSASVERGVSKVYFQNSSGQGCSGDSSKNIPDTGNFGIININDETGTRFGYCFEGGWHMFYDQPYVPYVDGGSISG